MEKHIKISGLNKYLKLLFPIPRSITGEGNRKTLRILQEIIGLKILEYPSGKKVYDWRIPDEWEVNDAWIKDGNGDKLIDLNDSNLHVMNYSSPVHQKMTFDALKLRLHYRKDFPDAIPYRMTYYKRDWGFCLSYNDFKKKFQAGKSYEVFINTRLKKGSLSCGEFLLPGSSTKEYLISTYICHPSLANDNLSGLILTAFLARAMKKRRLNFSYRFVFVPETIGALTYCAHHEDVMKKIEAGLVVTTVGGPGKIGYKQTFDKGHYINRIIEGVLRKEAPGFKAYPFDIHGSDERQYSSPGFRINTASVTKDKYYEYPQYHTSQDDLHFVKAQYLGKMLDVYLKVIEKIETRIVYRRTCPFGEAMLSRHDLYPKTGGAQLPTKKMKDLDKILWFLFYCDGKQSVEDIAFFLNCSSGSLQSVVSKLEEKGLIVKEQACV